jgi:hypothetical protein
MRQPGGTRGKGARNIDRFRSIIPKPEPSHPGKFGGETLFICDPHTGLILIKFFRINAEEKDVHSCAKKSSSLPMITEISWRDYVFSFAPRATMLSLQWMAFLR